MTCLFIPLWIITICIFPFMILLFELKWSSNDSVLEVIINLVDSACYNHTCNFLNMYMKTTPDYRTLLLFLTGSFLYHIFSQSCSFVYGQSSFSLGSHSHNCMYSHQWGAFSTLRSHHSFDLPFNLIVFFLLLHRD